MSGEGREYMFVSSLLLMGDVIEEGHKYLFVSSSFLSLFAGQVWYSMSLQSPMREEGSLIPVRLFIIDSIAMAFLLATASRTDLSL